MYKIYILSKQLASTGGKLGRVQSTFTLLERHKYIQLHPDMYIHIHMTLYMYVYKPAHNYNNIMYILCVYMYIHTYV